jgi:hypothetical protein
MKRLLIILSVLGSVLGLAISTSAFGAGVSLPVNQLVTVPIQNAGWHVGAEALYLQPSSADLGYAMRQVIVPPVTTNYNVVAVKPKYKFGFGIDAGYHFAGTGNDLSAHFEHLRASSSSAVSGTVRSTFLIPLWPVAYNNGASAKAKYKYDAVDLSLGQLVNVGKRLRTHISAGVRYAALNSSMDARYYILGFPTDTIYLASDFKGIGPRLAMDGFYNLSRGFGIDAAIGSSLLIGSIKSKNNTAANSALPAPFVMNIDKASARHVVPELDAKLGVSYKRRVNVGVLSIGVGWQVMNYFDAQSRLLFVDTNSPTYVNHYSNICFNGPYLGFMFQTA